MMKSKMFKTLAVALLLAVPFTACDEDDDNPITTDPEVAAPTNLQAASGNNAVFLSWDASVDEDEDNFGSYEINILNKATNETLAPRTAAKGINDIRIDGLTNGVRYQFTVRSVTDLGNVSTVSATIEWSPAARQTTDNNGLPIKIYATTSTQFDSALDLYNVDGDAEVIPQAGQEFQDRGDLYLEATTNTAPMFIKSPAEADNQGLITQFSNQTPVSVNNLDDQLAFDPPADNSFTVTAIQIPDGAVQTGRVYWGRLARGNDYFYFRLLVKQGSNGMLVQGGGADRYIEMVASFQNAPNNPFAK